MDQGLGTPTPKRRAKIVIAGAVIVAAVVGLTTWAMSRPGSTAFYLTPTELAAAGPLDEAGGYRVNGKVVPGTVARDGLTTTFDVTDGQTTVTITTDRPLPDAFYSEDGVEVVAQGQFDGRLFTASDVFAKCPSKFKAKA